MLIDGGKGWLMVACPYWALFVLYWMLVIFTKYEMIDVWDTVSALIGLPVHELSLRKNKKTKTIGQVTMDLLYIRFTYYTKDNQQECSRLYNWFSLWYLGTWVNHLPPVWWFIFRFSLLNVNCFVSLVWLRGIFLLVSCLYSCFIHYPVLPIIFLLFSY